MKHIKRCSVQLIIHEKQIKTMLNNAAMNISLFMGKHFHFSWVYTPRNEIHSS